MGTVIVEVLVGLALLWLILRILFALSLHVAGNRALGPTVPPRSLENKEDAWHEEPLPGAPKDIAAPEESIEVVGHAAGEKPSASPEAESGEPQSAPHS